MNIEQARFNMIEQQIRPWDVLDKGVLGLLAVVRREEQQPIRARCTRHGAPADRQRQANVLVRERKRAAAPVEKQRGWRVDVRLRD